MGNGKWETLNSESGKILKYCIEIILHLLTFMVNPIMNLISRLYHKYKRSKHYFSYFENI